MASFPRRNRWWSLSVASIATLIVTADTGQVSIALPAIIAEFNADLTLASWIALVHALITASLYLPCGRLSDLVGIGKLFLAGFILYAASSVAAGLAQGAGQLLFFRAMQAAGSALVMANNFALVTALFPPEERGRAMGIAGGTISAMGYTIGPVLGGLLTHGFGWRSNFYVSALLAVAGFSAARVLLPPESFAGSWSPPGKPGAPLPSSFDSRRSLRTTPRFSGGIPSEWPPDMAGARVEGSAKKEPFDFVGALAFALTISLLLFALMILQKGAGQQSLVGLAALGGIAALGFFAWWETRQSFPLLDLKLFRIPAFTLGNGARWISFIAMSVNSLLMPFFLQMTMGLDPLRAGLLVAPMPFAMALLAPITGWMSERFVPERLCALGLAVTSVALVFLSFLSARATAFEVVFGLAGLGVGMGLFQTPNNNLLMSSVPRQRLGIGSSFLSIVRSLGYSTGAALAAAIVSSQLLAATGQISLHNLTSQAGVGNHSSVTAPFLKGFHYAYLTAAALCFIGAVVSAVRVSER